MWNVWDIFLVQYSLDDLEAKVKEEGACKKNNLYLERERDLCAVARVRMYK